MFTTSKTLMITAATLIPLVVLAPTPSAAFGLGGFGHMGHMGPMTGGSLGGGFSHMSAMSRGPMGGGLAHMGTLNRGPIGGGLAHTSGLNHARGPMSGEFAHTGATKTTGSIKPTAGVTHASNANPINKAGGGDVARRGGATAAGNDAHHPTTSVAKNDAHKPQTPTDAKRSGNDGRTNTDEPSRAHSDHGERGHGPTVYVPSVPLIPPVLTDDRPKLPGGGPVFADGGGSLASPGGDTEGDGEGSGIPGVDLVNEDEDPCLHGILKVTSAHSECVDGVVHIKGSEYYYCPSGRYQERHYDYTPVIGLAKISCGGTGTVQGPQWVLPKGWEVMPKGQVCNRKKDKDGNDVNLKVWVPGAVNWELYTWEVFECTDDDGNTVDRVGWMGPAQISSEEKDTGVKPTSVTLPPPITEGTLHAY
jgi:hypothetical protein